MTESIARLRCQCNTEPLAGTLVAMLDGTDFASARMPWGRPGPIRLPAGTADRRALVDAHVRGGPADLTSCPAGQTPKNVRVSKLELAALCPGADGLCRWLGYDLDGENHGSGGLADPLHALRCVAERADAAGLSRGLLAGQSRSGQGVHVFLNLPRPIPLSDAAVGAAALIAQAFAVAESDSADFGAPSAFRAVGGAIARPGDAGAVEMVPHGTVRPPRGWSLALPSAAEIIGLFTGAPTALTAVPRCEAPAWARFVAEARAMLARQRAARPHPRSVAERKRGGAYVWTGRRALNARTRDFLAGRVAPGGRNVAAFAASCDLLGSGMLEDEARAMILAGAVLCELPKREATACLESARKAVQR